MLQLSSLPSPPTPHSDGGYQRMLFALEQCDFSFGKTQMVIDMNKAEMARYKALSVDIGTVACVYSVMV